MKDLDELKFAQEESLAWEQAKLSDEFHRTKRIEFYGREIAKLAEGLISKPPATSEEAIEWSAEVMAYTRALCGEWTSVHRGRNIGAAFDLSAEVYADFLDGEEFDCK